MAKDLTIEEIQAVELDLLAFLDEMCREHGIEYCLAWGSALGARRHQGFIPWDDDLDVYVKQADVDRLVTCINAQPDGRYRVLAPNDETGYHHPYPKLVRTDTELIEPDNVQVDAMGVFIDLFPCRFLPRADALSRIKERFVELLWKVYCQVYVRSSSPSGLKGLFRRASAYVGHLISAKRAFNLIDSLGRIGTFESGRYASCPYDSSIIFPSEMIFPTSRYAFEGLNVPCPSKLDDYCRKAYGPSYMTPIKMPHSFHGIARFREGE